MLITMTALSTNGCLNAEGQRGNKSFYSVVNIKRNWTWLCSRLSWLCHPPSSATSYWCLTEDAEKANPTLLVEPFWCYVVFISHIKLIAWVFWFGSFCFILFCILALRLWPEMIATSRRLWNLTLQRTLVHANSDNYLCFHKELGFGVTLQEICSTLLVYALNL